MFFAPAEPRWSSRHHAGARKIHGLELAPPLLACAHGAGAKAELLVAELLLESEQPRTENLGAHGLRPVGDDTAKDSHAIEAEIQSMHVQQMRLEPVVTSIRPRSRKAKAAMVRMEMLRAL